MKSTIHQATTTSIFYNELAIIGNNWMVSVFLHQTFWWVPGGFSVRKLTAFHTFVMRAHNQVPCPESLFLRLESLGVDGVQNGETLASAFFLSSCFLLLGLQY